MNNNMESSQNTEEKCLTTEAMDKCPCEFCKLMRKARDQQIEWIMKMELKSQVEKGKCQ